jgi:hypothetical protein
MRTLDPRLAAALCAAVVLLSGCGGNPAPAPAPAPAKTPSPSAAASPSPPVMPEAARARTREGAIVLVRHFLLALNYSGRAGDTTGLRNAYVALCTRCEALADSIDDTYDAGGYYEGGDWLARKITFYKIDRDVAILDARVDYTAQTWLERKGAKPRTFKASRNHVHAFQLKWSAGDGWRVGALDPQQ